MLFAIAVCVSVADESISATCEIACWSIWRI